MSLGADTPAFAKLEVCRGVRVVEQLGKSILHGVNLALSLHKESNGSIKDISTLRTLHGLPGFSTAGKAVDRDFFNNFY